MPRKRLAVPVLGLALTLIASSAQAVSVTPPPTSFAAECPATITCVVDPAAYAMNNAGPTPNDPGYYGNFDVTNRPHDMKINSIVIHDTEGDLDSVLALFKDPNAYVSAHYVVSGPGCKVTQMVQTKNMAWHAGWYANMHSIGIEVVGFSATGGVDYTSEKYRCVAELVKYSAKKYDIPLDREHIVGHDNVPAVSPGGITATHTDPGPYWNWQDFMWRLGAPVLPTAGLNAKMVTVAPIWKLNKQKVTGCWNTICTPTSPQPTNFVYVRTAPSNNAPFFVDSVLGAGSTEITNNAARAFYGQTFVVNQRKVNSEGLWYQVWFNGKLGWIDGLKTFPASGKMVTPKAGLASVPVYGRPLPEQSDYPTDFVPPEGAIPTATAFPYVMSAGQKYKLAGPAINDYFYAWTIDGSQDAYDHTAFQGSTKYLQVQFGNRFAYVKAADVVVK